MQNDESVRGTIIGDVTFPYQFWITEKLHPSLPDRYTVTRKVADRFFVNDKQAVEWFKENYPNEYKHGVEMRCFDCVGNSL